MIPPSELKTMFPENEELELVKAERDQAVSDFKVAQKMLKACQETLVAVLEDNKLLRTLQR